MKIKHIALVYILFCLMGIWLLTKFWLPSGYMIAGHDSGLAVSAGEFFKTRLMAWDNQDFGYDNSTHFGSLVLHGIDYLTATVSGVFYAGNQFNIFLWLSLIFFASFLFAYKLKENLGKYSFIFFPVFVTINFFILQSLFILERAKYAILVASILVFWNVVNIRDKKINLFVSAILTSIALTVFNSGSWLGLPLYGGVVVLVFSSLLFESLWSLRDKDPSGLKRLVLYYFLVTIGFLLLNAYSIFPYLATFLRQDYSSLINPDVIDLNRRWLASLSQAGSFLNFFRLQGVPDWYSGTYGINLSHSYASNYLLNPWFILVSISFSIIAFLSLVLAKSTSEKRLISFFGLTALLSMIFMAGSHGPLGKIYEFLFTYLPGFAIFRSPYFKFASVFFISISGMMAFTFSKIIESATSRFQGKTKTFLSLSFCLLIVSGWLLYHDVIFDSNKVFEWQKGYSTKVKVPVELFDFHKNIKNLDTQDKRILLLPPLNPVWTNDSYSWGYWSLTTLPSVLVNKSFLTNSSGLTFEERNWVEHLYKQIKTEDEEKFLEIAKKLNVGFVLVRSDVSIDSSWSAQEDPYLYEEAIKEFDSMEKVFTSGQWSIYRIKDASANMINVQKDIVFIPSTGSYLGRTLVSNNMSFIGDSQPEYLDIFARMKFTVFNCQSCQVESKKYNDFLPTIRILPDSKLYFFKEYKETKTLENLTQDKDRISAYMGYLLRRGAETISMINYWAKEEDISLNMSVMNKYLELLNEQLISTSDSTSDFSTVSQFLDNLRPVELNFQAFTKRDDFGKKGMEFRKEMLEVLWRIYNIKKYYSPILSDLSRWQTEKVYQFQAKKPGNHSFYIDKTGLPVDLNGKVIYPTKVEFHLKSHSGSLPIFEENGWLKFNLEIDVPQQVKIVLRFNDLPNLFDSKGESLAPLPSGEKTCLSGKIKNFKQLATYKIFIKANKNSKAVKLLIQDRAILNFSDETFLHGENEVIVEQDSVNEPFEFLYRPMASDLNPEIFVCSATKDVPDIEYVKVVEIATPPLIYIDEISSTLGSEPKINYSQIDNTRYEVTVENVTEPYVLSLNQRYNPFWQVFKDDKPISQDKHFIANGYSNGWRIDETGTYKITIKYNLQKFLYIGSGVSLLSLTLFLAYLIRFKRLRKNK